MKRYRIISESGKFYNGCIPITVHWVQVYRKGFFGGKWENVKGFDRIERARQLLDLLNSKP